MLAQRILVAIVLLPVGMAVIHLGGWAYTSFIMLILALAAREFVQLFRTSGYQPAGFLVIIGVLALALGRAIDGFASSSWMLTLLILTSTVYHLAAYERGRQQAGADFGITLAGILYIGWLGAYFISLRSLPEGKWWVLLVLPGVWFADTAAYSIGRRLGRHKLNRRLSPNKSWEGYLAGIVAGTLATGLLAVLWSSVAGPNFKATLWQGLGLGFAMGVLPTLGDLGESMIKRQAGVKDSGNLLPGHGGVFDRIDSWLWAVVIGYYIVAWLFV